MNKKLILKIVSSVILILIILGFVWAWNVTRIVRKNSSNDSMQNQHAVIQNIIVMETQDEKKYWEFYAKSGEYNSEHNSVLLNDVIGNFYNKDEEVILSFKSDKGSYDELSKKVVLNGDNVFVGKDGSRLHADELIWQGQDKDILANGNVQFIQIGKIVAKANKAVFNSTLTKFKIMESAKTRIYTDEESKKKFIP